MSLLDLLLTLKLSFLFIISNVYLDYFFLIKVENELNILSLLFLIFTKPIYERTLSVEFEYSLGLEYGLECFIYVTSLGFLLIKFAFLF